MACQQCCSWDADAGSCSWCRTSKASITTQTPALQGLQIMHATTIWLDHPPRRPLMEPMLRYSRTRSKSGAPGHHECSHITIGCLQARAKSYEFCSTQHGMKAVTRHLTVLNAWGCQSKFSVLKTLLAAWIHRISQLQHMVNASCCRG